MKKLRVFTAIGMTFAFIVQHIVDVLIIVWLPLVLQLAAFFALIPGYTVTTMRLQANGPPTVESMGELLPAYGQLGLFMLVALATSVALVSGLTKLIVKGEKPRLPFYIGWGADEWRILGGWLLTGLILGGVQLAGVILTALLARLLGGGGMSIAIAVLTSLVGLVACIWIGIRLSMLVPVTVETGKMGLRKSWEETEDDFWNLVGYWVIFIVATIVIQLLLIGYMTPPGVFAAYQGMDPRDPETVREAARNANEAMARGYDLSDSANVVRLLAGYLIGSLIGIVTAAAGAVVWRMISDNPNEVAETF